MSIEVLSSGLSELMKTQEIQTLLKEEADKIANRCEGNYETDVFVGRTRANASIKTRDAKTFHKNLKDNELLRNLKG